MSTVQEAAELDLRKNEEAHLNVLDVYESRAIGAGLTTREEIRSQKSIVEQKYRVLLGADTKRVSMEALRRMRAARGDYVEWLLRKH